MNPERWNLICGSRCMSVLMRRSVCIGSVPLCIGCHNELLLLKRWMDDRNRQDPNSVDQIAEHLFHSGHNNNNNNTNNNSTLTAIQHLVQEDFVHHDYQHAPANLKRYPLLLHIHRKHRFLMHALSHNNNKQHHQQQQCTINQRISSIS